MILVPSGVFRLTSDVSINNRIRFEGTVSMPANRKLTLTRNFDLDTYGQAFGSEIEGFKRALQALFYFTDHVTLDLSGRRVDMTEPIDVAERGGADQLHHPPGGAQRVAERGCRGRAGTTETVTSVATYSAATTFHADRGGECGEHPGRRRW